MTPEGRVKKQIKDYLTSISAYQFWPVQTGYGAATVDVLVCYRGRFVAIEVKASGKKPTPRQNNTMDAVVYADGIAFWTDNIDEVKRRLPA